MTFHTVCLFNCTEETLHPLCCISDSIKGDVSHLEQDKELKDPPEGRREQSGVRDGHLEEEGVKEAVADVDEGVLVDVGVSHPVGSHVVVQRDVVVVGLVLRHGLYLWMIQLTAQTDS